MFVDESADVGKAVEIAFNAKCRRYGVCGAMETLLLASPIAQAVLEQLVPRYQEVDVELRGCERACSMIVECTNATEADWETEYLAPILAIRIVDGLGEAIAHIHLLLHRNRLQRSEGEDGVARYRSVDPVSYTHLTLPTILLV